jgi:alpha-L-fucosidase
LSPITDFPIVDVAQTFDWNFKTFEAMFEILSTLFRKREVIVKTLNPKNMKNVIIPLCCVIFVLTIGCSTQKKEAVIAPRYSADFTSLAAHNEQPDWFQDAKLGIYFHWGVYSVPAFGNEWYPRNMHFKESREYQHHVKTYGEPSEFGYHDFVPMFKAENFNADERASLFKQAGARFAGPVAEHHDGYSMWASKLTPWNSLDTGPHAMFLANYRRL